MLPEVKTVLPGPFEWCEIPAGITTIEDTSHYAKPGTRGGEYEVTSFFISRYPVTNRQYQVFVDANDGYRLADWWSYSAEARQWRSQCPAPSITAFAGDTLPRTHICWYDAVAFCHWLTERTGQRILLPTEQQWQRAAQGDDRLMYPWGNEFDPQCCNTSVEHESHGPTPVTQYPNGASPFDVLDLTGNVWEWCCTMWCEDSYDLSGNCPRVLLGGAWNVIYSYDIRTANRYRFYPSYESNDIGFRVVGES